MNAEEHQALVCTNDLYGCFEKRTSIVDPVNHTQAMVLLIWQDFAIGKQPVQILIEIQFQFTMMQKLLAQSFNA